MRADQRPAYSTEPDDKERFTREFDQTYTLIAGVYDLAVKVLPVWKSCNRQRLPKHASTGERLSKTLDPASVDSEVGVAQT